VGPMGLSVSPVPTPDRISGIIRTRPAFGVQRFFLHGSIALPVGSCPTGARATAHQQEPVHLPFDSQRLRPSQHSYTLAGAIRPHVNLDGVSQVPPTRSTKAVTAFRRIQSATAFRSTESTTAFRSTKCATASFYCGFRQAGANSFSASRVKNLTSIAALHSDVKSDAPPEDLRSTRRCFVLFSEYFYM
jgi:hypothetical protein